VVDRVGIVAGDLGSGEVIPADQRGELDRSNLVALVTVLPRTSSSARGVRCYWPTDLGLPAGVGYPRPVLGPVPGRAPV